MINAMPVRNSTYIIEIQRGTNIYDNSGTEWAPGTASTSSLPIVQALEKLDLLVLSCSVVKMMEPVMKLTGSNAFSYSKSASIIDNIALTGLPVEMQPLQLLEPHAESG
jgi:hypothetical protein